MICPQCRGAGLLLTQVKQGEAFGPTILLASARDWHRHCTDPNCTCQHEVTVDALRAGP